MIFMVLSLMHFLFHCSKYICLTYNTLKITVMGGIHTFFTETAHPAIRTRAGIGSLTDAAVLAWEPADSWKHHNFITNSAQ